MTAPHMLPQPPQAESVDRQLVAALQDAIFVGYLAEALSQLRGIPAARLLPLERQSARLFRDTVLRRCSDVPALASFAREVLAPTGDAAKPEGLRLVGAEEVCQFCGEAVA